MGRDADSHVFFSSLFNGLAQGRQEQSMRQLLRDVILSQHANLYGKKIVERSFPKAYMGDTAPVVLYGSHGSGVTMMLHQLRRSVAENDYFFDFDDARLVRFGTDDFEHLTEVLTSLYGVQHTYFFNDIGLVPGWETFVAGLTARGNKVFVTVTNAAVLSGDDDRVSGLSCHRVPVLPLSFREYLSMRGRAELQKDYERASCRAELQTLFHDYLENGGLPDYLLTGDDKVLTALYDTIVYRDVMVRNLLVNAQEMREVIFYLMSRIGQPITYTMVRDYSGIKNVTTVKSYMEDLENAYFIHPVLKVDEDGCPLTRSPRCVYAMDNAMMRKTGYRYNDDRTPMVSNVVYQELLRRGHEVCFAQTPRFDCDFVIRTEGRVTAALQVLNNWENDILRTKRLRGLMMAMDMYNLSEGTLICDAPSKEILSPMGPIRIVSPWNWLIEG